MNTPNPKKIPVINIDATEENANWLRTLKREREQGLHPELDEKDRKRQQQIDQRNQTPEIEDWQTEENENWLRQPKTPTRQPTKQNPL